MIARIFRASLSAAIFVACAPPAAAQGGGEILEENVVACTGPDAASGFLGAMRRDDTPAMNRFLAEETCSRFGQISYSPIRIIHRARGEGDHHIIHARMFHLIDIYVISRRAGQASPSSLRSAARLSHAASSSRGNRAIGALRTAPVPPPHRRPQASCPESVSWSSQSGR